MKTIAAGAGFGHKDETEEDAAMREWNKREALSLSLGKACGRIQLTIPYTATER